MNAREIWSQSQKEKVTSSHSFSQFGIFSPVSSQYEHYLYNALKQAFELTLPPNETNLSAILIEIANYFRETTEVVTGARQEHIAFMLQVLFLYEKAETLFTSAEIRIQHQSLLKKFPVLAKHQHEQFTARMQHYKNFKNDEGSACLFMKAILDFDQCIQDTFSYHSMVRQILTHLSTSTNIKSLFADDLTNYNYAMNTLTSAIATLQPSAHHYSSYI